MGRWHQRDGVLQHSFLRPLRLQQQVGPHPTGLLEEIEELWLGRRNSRRERGRAVHLTFLLPGTCLLLALCAVVLTLGKGRTLLAKRRAAAQAVHAAGGSDASVDTCGMNG